MNKNALDVAKYILYFKDRKDISNRKITNIDLNLMLYYLQEYNMLTKGEPLFNDEIYASIYGPYIKNVWNEYRRYNDKDIPYDKNLDREFLNKYKDLDNFISMLFTFDRIELSTIATKPKTPWSYAFNNKDNHEITNEMIYKYFKSLRNEYQDKNKIEDILKSNLKEEPKSKSKVNPRAIALVVASIYLGLAIPYNVKRKNTHNKAVKEYSIDTDKYSKDNIIILINKDNHDIKACYLKKSIILDGDNYDISSDNLSIDDLNKPIKLELYDLDSKKLLIYIDNTNLNKPIDYDEDEYKKLIKNNYQISLSEIDNTKDYYTDSEIKTLENRFNGVKRK